MKIYDCFSYWDEDLLLDLRLNILNSVVDYFVIIEGNKTWQNNFKEFRFDIKKFEKFEKKIIYIQVNDLPDGDDPFKRENFQRNSITRGLSNSSDEDLIIISDLDEIPNPKKIYEFNPKKRFAVFKQKHFYYKFNLLNKDLPNWYGSRICKKKYLKSPQWLRDLKFKKRPFWRIDKFRLNNIIEDGGWHFCNLKNPTELLYKYQNLCETNDPYHFKEKIDQKFLSIESIKNMIDSNKDIIGREHNYIKIPIDKTYPKYLYENINKFKEWIA